MKPRSFSLILGLVALAAMAAFATHALTTPATAATSNAGLHFHNDYGTASALARSQNKPLIVIFSASWCPPCQQMKNSVYPSSQVAPYHDDFVWAYLDADSPKNSALMQRHRVQGIPHIAFEDPNGKSIGKLVGGVPASRFAQVLDGVKSKVETSAPTTTTPEKMEKKTPFRLFSRGDRA